MAYITKYDDLEKKILLENYGCNIQRYLNIQKLELELVENYVLNGKDKNDIYLLLQEIIAINLIISKKSNEEKRRK